MKEVVFFKKSKFRSYFVILTQYRVARKSRSAISPSTRDCINRNKEKKNHERAILATRKGIWNQKFWSRHVIWWMLSPENKKMEIGRILSERKNEINNERLRFDSFTIYWNLPIIWCNWTRCLGTWAILTLTKLTPKHAIQPQPPSGATFLVFFCIFAFVVSSIAKGRAFRTSTHQSDTTIFGFRSFRLRVLCINPYHSQITEFLN